MPVKSSQPMQPWPVTVKWDFRADGALNGAVLLYEAGAKKEVDSINGFMRASKNFAVEHGKVLERRFVIDDDATTSIFKEEAQRRFDEGKRVFVKVTFRDPGPGEIAGVAGRDGRSVNRAKHDDARDAAPALGRVA